MIKGSHHSEETKSLMRAHSGRGKGTKWSMESKMNLSIARSGKNNPNYGKKLPHSPEVRAKISAALKGRTRSAEVRRNMSIAQIGKKHSLESRQKMSNSRKGIRYSPDAIAKMSAAKRGHHVSPETRTKISEKMKTRMSDPTERERLSIKAKGRIVSVETRKKLSECQRGERGSNWQGGVSFGNYCPKFNEDLKRRIRAFFEYNCSVCGKTTEENGRQLSCHHVEYSKSACCDGKPVHFAALCQECHGKTNHNMDKWEAMLHRIIDEIYDGKSYFTKDECDNPDTKTQSSSKIWGSK
jgi:hypothetical protein